MKIGYYQNNYQNVRNIINIVPECSYIWDYDPTKIKRYFLRYLNRTLCTHFKNDFVAHEIDLPVNVDLFHFSNFISFGSKPWIATFEETLPYGSFISQNRTNKCIAVMRGPKCKKLIALSECTLNLQKKYMEKFPESYEDIARKLTVIHPPQKLLVNNFEEKKLSLQGPIKFIFVGYAFLRKGGHEILEVFSELRNVMKLNIELTIISNLQEDYTGADNVAKRDIVKIIESNKDWIFYFDRLDNKSVLELMKKSHIGLLPTYHDTYGYSVLEFQAAGCPVISTDVRALPEINDNDKGWLISVPKQSSGDTICRTSEGRKGLSGAIRTGLRDVVIDIYANRSIIIEKSNKVIQYIKKNHCPIEHANKLREIYLRALY